MFYLMLKNFVHTISPDLIKNFFFELFHKDFKVQYIICFCNWNTIYYVNVCLFHSSFLYYNIRCIFFNGMIILFSFILIIHFKDFYLLFIFSFLYIFVYIYNVLKKFLGYFYIIYIFLSSLFTYTSFLCYYSLGIK